MNGQVLQEESWTRHSHTGDPILPKVREVQSLIRAQAATGMDSTRSVVSSNLVNVSENVLQRMPKRATLDDNVRAKRRATNPIEPNPQGLNFEIPERYQNLILHDSGSEDPDRFLILGKQELLNTLENADLWLGDGTFSVCPSMFYQLYTIHCKVGNNYPPCVYFLLKNKTQATYVRVLKKLKELIPNASPDVILVDFETAPINAFREVFEDAVQKCCLFHHGQCINRRINELGLKKAYEENEEFNMAVKSLLALTFVPEDDVIDRFYEVVERLTDLAEEYPELERVDELCNYFELTFVRGAQRPGRQRLPARYPIALWNHFTDPGNDVPRTTNAVEGYHHGLNSLFLSQHPSLWKLLTGLEMDMALHLKTLADDQVANNPPRRQKYLALTQRLAEKVNTYATTPDKLRYLRAVANIFSSA